MPINLNAISRAMRRESDQRRYLEYVLSDGRILSTTPRMHSELCAAYPHKYAPYVGTDTALCNLDIGGALLITDASDVIGSDDTKTITYVGPPIYVMITRIS